MSGLDYLAQSILQGQQRNAANRYRMDEDQDRQLAQAMMMQAYQSGNPQMILEATAANPYATQQQYMNAYHQVADQKREQRQRQAMLAARESVKNSDDPRAALTEMLAFGEDVPHNMREKAMALWFENQTQEAPTNTDSKLAAAVEAYKSAGSVQEKALLVAQYPQLAKVVEAEIGLASMGTGGDPLIQSDDVLKRDTVKKRENVASLHRNVADLMQYLEKDEEGRDFIDEHFEWGPRAGRFVDKIESGLGMADDDEEKGLTDHAEFSSKVETAFNAYRHMITGAAAATSELEMLRKAFPSTGVKVTAPEFRGLLRGVTSGMQREIQYYNDLLGQGYSVEDAQSIMKSKLHGTHAEFGGAGGKGEEKPTSENGKPTPQEIMAADSRIVSVTHISDGPPFVVSITYKDNDGGIIAGEVQWP